MTLQTLSRRASRLAVLLTVLGALAVAGPARAEDKTAYDDTKLDAFAEATIQVHIVKMHWVAKLKAAQSQDEFNDLNKQANDALLATVNNVDNMSVEEYNAIVKAANADEALTARIDDRIKVKLESRKATQ